MLGDLGAHLGGVAVDGLLAAEDHVEFALGVLHLPDGLGEDVAGGQGVRPAEGPVGEEIGLVRGDGQAFPQGGLRLGGSHAQHHDLGVGVVVLDAGGRLQGVAVKGVDDAGHAVPDQSVGLRIDLDLVGVRDLLYTYQNVHKYLLFSARMAVHRL